MKSQLRFFLGVRPVERPRIRLVGRAHQPCLRRRLSRSRSSFRWFAAGSTTIARMAAAASARREEPKALGREMRPTHIKVKARFAAPSGYLLRWRRCTPCADEASCRRCNTGLRHRGYSEGDASGESGYKAPPHRGVLNDGRTGRSGMASRSCRKANSGRKSAARQEKRIAAH